MSTNKPARAYATLVAGKDAAGVLRLAHRSGVQLSGVVADRLVLRRMVPGASQSTRYNQIEK